MPTPPDEPRVRDVAYPLDVTFVPDPRRAYVTVVFERYLADDMPYIQRRMRCGKSFPDAMVEQLVHELQEAYDALGLSGHFCVAGISWSGEEPKVAELPREKVYALLRKLVEGPPPQNLAADQCREALAELQREAREAVEADIPEEADS